MKTFSIPTYEFSKNLATNLSSKKRILTKSLCGLSDFVFDLIKSELH